MVTANGSETLMSRNFSPFSVASATDTLQILTELPVLERCPAYHSGPPEYRP